MKIVYNSFHGRYSDSPRALYEHLADRPGLDHVWLADPAHPFPAGVATVPVESPQAVEALESADLLVANTHTEVEWDKPVGTTYLQTWHGTPLKRIHRDVLWAPAGRLDRLDRDVAKWDLLVSPNRVSTPRLRQAFRYDGRVVETGYPRNDALSHPDRDAARDVIRKELGLGDDVTAVLYTPTWRDDECFQEGQPEVPLALDLAELTSRLGDGHVVLTRLHYMMTGRAQIASLPGVRDVSYYPDVRDLYLAADALVTDYSSTMFDFAITGKPILYFAYDLDRFQSTVRGFYFDLAAEAPGPMLTSVGDLADGLLDLPGVEKEYAARYDRFRETYCHLEDGRATQRIVELLGL